MKNREKKILNEEKNKTNSFVNGMANDKNQDFIIKENKNRIRYRKKIINKSNYFNSSKNKYIFNGDENKSNSMLIPQKDKEISNPNNQNIFIKEKLNGQLKNNKDKNNKNIESDKIIEDEGNNNFMYDIKEFLARGFIVFLN